ncbi:MAG: SIMPL domain-containing protein [Campylobacterota bacterium]|nr:SIMPL domain-containing protein [Campylobacterota bacterium]
MKKIFLILVISFSLSSAFEVHKNNQFTQEVEPTKMSTSIIASMEDESKLTIQKVFTKAIESSKSENICTNGSYRISPQYRYDKQTRVFAGYRGSITFRCEFKDSKKLDRVITKLEKKIN